MINRRKVAILVPAPGVKVPCPRTGQMLPEGGKRVALSTYWTRRIADGSVSIKKEEENSKRGKA